MKRILLTLWSFLFWCQVASAHQGRVVVSDEAPDEAASAINSHGPGAVAALFARNSISAGDLAPDSIPAGSAQGKKPKPSPRPVGESQMPTIQSIKVGYLDSAIIGSQIRLRFDDSLHSLVPDRAEFFYAKCGCYADLPVSDPQMDPKAPGPGPRNAADLTFQQLFLNVEYAANYRFSIFGEVPMRSIEYLRWGNFPAPDGQQRFTNLIGLSDVNAGVKLAVLASPSHYLTVQLQGIFPTGDAAIGMGTHHVSIVPALLYYQRLTQYWSIDSEFSDTHPIGGAAGLSSSGGSGFAGDVLFYGVGPSYELVTSEKFHLSPVLEMAAWRVVGGFQTTEASGGISANGTNVVNMKWGARMSFGSHSTAYVGFGTSLTSATWYRDIFRIEYRYSFGKF